MTPERGWFMETIEGMSVVNPQAVTRVVASEQMSKGTEKELEYFFLYGGKIDFPAPRRREAIEHTRRKLGL